jgi:hypothetical protein
MLHLTNCLRIPPARLRGGNNQIMPSRQRGQHGLARCVRLVESQVTQNLQLFVQICVGLPHLQRKTVLKERAGVSAQVLLRPSAVS